MLQFARNIVAPLILAAAIITAGATAQHVAAPPAHHPAGLADQICPAATNWDNVINACA